MEYIMIIGLLLLVTIPLFVYAFVEVKRSIQMNHADDAVNTIANAADTVYSLGLGSKKYVWITTPGGVTQTLVDGNEVSMKLYIFKGEADVFATTKPVVIGSIPAARGQHRISVESLGSGVVRVGEAPDDTTPPVITRTYPSLNPGEKVCPGLVTVGADTDEPATCKYFRDEAYMGKEDWGLWTDEFEGRALSHYITNYHSEGIYSYYVRCEDYYDNVMDYGNSANITFEVGTPCIGEAGPGGLYGPGGSCYGQPEDYDEPAVTPVVPGDWEIMTFPVVDFNYTVTDTTSGIEYCVVNISTTTGEPDYGLGDLYAQAHDSSVSETEINSIPFAFNDKGIFIWNIFCVDDSCAHNQGASDYRTINVSKNFFDAFLSSCAGWCGWEGYPAGGICMLNSNKCDSGCNPGWTYDPDDNCYTGEDISNEYCQGAGVPPACCCLPNT